MNTKKNIPLTDFYQLEFNLNGKIPYRKIFEFRKKNKKIITNTDFPILLEHIKEDITLLKYRKFNRKQRKEE
jgi:hypothetical protein